MINKANDSAVKFKQILDLYEHGMLCACFVDGSKNHKEECIGRTELIKLFCMVGTHD